MGATLCDFVNCMKSTGILSAKITDFLSNSHANTLTKNQVEPICIENWSEKRLGVPINK